MHVLTVVSGPAADRSVEFENEVVIGREGADLDIADPRLSRRHALLRVEGDSVVCKLTSSPGDPNCTETPWPELGSHPDARTTRVATD